MGDWYDIDLTAATGSSGHTGRVVRVAFMRLNTRPTVCAFPDRRDAGYYCIRASKHRGRHRYGVVIEGSFKARSA